VTTIADIIAEHEGREGPFLPTLHDVQKAFGHVSGDAIREIVSLLSVTRT
jgi:formate dehydrogenase subunit gamma